VTPSPESLNRLLGNALVRTMAVVVAPIGAQHSFQMARIHDQEVVEAFGPDRPHEPPGVGIGIRGPKRRAQHLSAGAGEDGVEARDVLRIPVTEEKLDLDALVFEVGGDVSRLLGDPGTVRMVSHPRDPNPSAAEFDEEEHVEPPEPERVEGEEVGGHDMGCLRSQECPPCGPCSPGGRSYSMVLQDPGDRARRQTDTELDQLALDAAVAPPRILLRQTDNEPRGLLVDR